MKIVQEFVASQTDEVLEQALKRMPPEIYKIRHEDLLAKLKARRANIPQAMSTYFKFINKTVDIKLSDKSENVTISDTQDKGLRILIQSGEADSSALIMDNLYDPAITREVRIYTAGGTDSIQVNSSATAINLRIIGGKGEKVISGTAKGPNVRVYGEPGNTRISPADRFKVRLSNDTAGASDPKCH